MERSWLIIVNTDVLVIPVKVILDFSTHYTAREGLILRSLFTTAIITN